MSTVHWHEGLFLQPHHLQTFQRNVYQSVFGERRFSMAFPYGVLQMRLALDDLEDQRVRFDRLHIALRGGAVFRFPEDAELPTLDIRQAMRERQGDFMIYLAVPLWINERANSIEHGAAVPGRRVKMIWQVGEIETADENSGRNLQPVQVRRLNGMLMFHDEDLSDMEYIPLIRVTREVSGEGAGLPKADPRFVPATLLMRGAPVLMELVRDLAGQTGAVREELATHLSATPLDLRNLQGLQYEQMSRLRAINRYAARLPALLEERGAAGNIPPFEIYLELRDFLAELTALYPARGDFDCAPYNHDDPYPPFLEVVTKIRSYLGGVVKPRYRKIDFRLEDGLFVGDVSPDLFEGATGFYLALETPMDPAALVRLVENSDQFKLMPASFGVRAIRGIALKEERHAPYELPAKARNYYYRLDPEASRRIWDQFVREPQAIIHFEHADHSKFRIALYVTVPNPVS